MKEGHLFEYTHGSSLFYRLNPALKLLLLAAVCISAAALPEIPVFIITAITAVLYLSTLKTAAGLKQIRVIMLFIIITGVIRGYSVNSVPSGIATGCRMLAMLFAGSVFYSTTRLNRLNSEILKITGTNAAALKLSGMLVMTAAFLPVIFRTMEELRQARYSRCFSAGVRDLKSLFRFITMTTVPLLRGMLVHTDGMADAWYSRCYGSRNITDLNQPIV